MRYEDTWWKDHLDEYIKILEGYVSFKSIAVPSPDPDMPFGIECYRMLEYMKDVMSSYGMDSRIHDSVVADGMIHGTASEGRKKIAIICHGDVVAADGEWDRDPFSLYRKDDHLVGRGTTDNKGAAIAVLFAMRCLQDRGWAPRNDFILRIGSAEEIGMKDIPLAKSMPKADFTLVPDSGFPVAYGEKGSIKVEFSFPWKSPVCIAGGNGTAVIDRAFAYGDNIDDFQPDMVGSIFYQEGRIVSVGIGRHPATPEGGKDAVVRLLRFLLYRNVVQDKDDRRTIADIVKLFGTFYGEGLEIGCSDQASGRLTAVLTRIETEESCIRCLINIRTPISADVDQMIYDLERRFPNCKVLASSKGFFHEIDDLVEGLNDIACKEYGVEKDPYIMAGGTYARMFDNAVAFGMGSPFGNVQPPFPVGQGRAHQRNESVHIERMRKGFLIYMKALEYLDAGI